MPEKVNDTGWVIRGVPDGGRIALEVAGRLVVIELRRNSPGCAMLRAAFDAPEDVRIAVDARQVARLMEDHGCTTTGSPSGPAPTAAAPVAAPSAGGGPSAGRGAT